MKTCKKIKRDFAAFYYEELSQEEKKKISLHLKACQDCLAYFERFKETLAHIDKNRYAAEPGYNYTDEVMSKITSPKAAPSFKLSWMPSKLILRPAFAAVCTILLVAAVLIGNEQFKDKRQFIQVAQEANVEEGDIWQELELLQELDENNVEGNSADEDDIMKEQELLDELEMLGLT